MKPLHVWGRGAMMHTFQHRQGSCGPRVGPPHTGCPPGLGMEKWEKLEQAGWGREQTSEITQPWARSGDWLGANPDRELAPCGHVHWSTLCP